MKERECDRRVSVVTCATPARLYNLLHKGGLLLLPSQHIYRFRVYNASGF